MNDTKILVWLEPGDILHHSWGYDQTNCDFYEVVAVKGLMVDLRKISHHEVSGGGAAMSSMVMPDKGQYVDNSLNALNDGRVGPDEPIRKRVQAYLNGDKLEYYIRAKYGCCRLWDGNPCYESWYA